jgi:prohibitin 1
MTEYRGGSGGGVRDIYMARARRWLPGGVAVFAVLVLAVIVAATSVAYVPAGHVGVLTLFGRVTGEVLPEGTHLILPVKTNNRMAVRTQELKETASVPSEEGLIITLDTSLLFRLDFQKASDVYQKIGPNYIDVVIEPNLRSAIRSVTAAHNANALYTGAREEVAQQIQKELVGQLAPRGIIVENILLRDIQLPAMLKSSIEAKQQAEQDALRMTFVLQKEKQEAERKRIEAQGIADFQRIVAQGISPQLLEWKGIEATEKLASSTNSKVIMIGSPRTGLPIIFEPK